MAEKRKWVVFDLNQKIEIIKRLKKGETATSIALIYGVGRTTVNDTKRVYTVYFKFVNVHFLSFVHMQWMGVGCCLRFFCYPSIRLTITVPVLTLTVNRSFTVYHCHCTYIFILIIEMHQFHWLGDKYDMLYSWLPSRRIKLNYARI
jgi:hypothetical protein